MDRLLLTLPCENGELFYCLSGRRIALARCKPKIEIYEHTTRVRVIEDSVDSAYVYRKYRLAEDIKVYPAGVAEKRLFLRDFCNFSSKSARHTRISML